MNSDTVTAGEVRASVEDLFGELEDVGKRLARMTRALYRAGREVGLGSEMVKSALADEERSVARLSAALTKCWNLLESVDEDLAKLEREGQRGKGYAMPPSPHPDIAGLPFLAKSVARGVRPGSVPFDRRAATEAVAAYSGAIHQALRSTAASVAGELRRADLSKSADGDDDDSITDLAPAVLLSAATIAAIASHIVRGLDLGALQSLASDPTPGAFAADVASEALQALDLDLAPSVADQISTAAVKAATDRAHELVGLRAEHGGSVGNPGAARSIVDSTRDMVKQAVASGLQEGLSRDEIADSIAGLDAFSADRAEEIATNELRGVNEASQLLAWQGAATATGTEIRKRWFVDPSSKFCDACLDNQNQGPIALDELFQSGDDCPPMHPSCRCHVEPVIASSKAFNPQKRTLH